MKERPILMTPENAQKVHDGVKVQTRRIIKSQPAWVDEVALRRKYRTGMLTCPYGQVGDRLWIREAWMHKLDTVLEPPSWKVLYRSWYPQQRGPWIPSIHMPRWACRTVVELTDVRVERVQDCSEHDARDEGAAPCFEDWCGIVHSQPFYRWGWKKLWESINGADSWALNPWVWVLTFRKVEP